MRLAHFGRVFYFLLRTESAQSATDRDIYGLCYQEAFVSGFLILKLDSPHIIYLNFMLFYLIGFGCHSLAYLHLLDSSSLIIVYGIEHIPFILK
jgi:hypothetical protein